MLRAGQKQESSSQQENRAVRRLSALSPSYCEKNPSNSAPSPADQDQRLRATPMALPGTGGEVTRNAVLLGFTLLCKILGNWTPLFLLVNESSHFPLSPCLQAAMPGPECPAQHPRLTGGGGCDLQHSWFFKKPSRTGYKQHLITNRPAPTSSSLLLT